MSLTGEINKISGDVRRSIEKVAKNGMVSSDGSVRGTKKIFGYVCAIHEDGDLAGTIDVQEFNYEPDEYQTMGTGHHKGVLLSAIQDNKNGMQIVPMLYSEVVIVQNPTDGCEYVLMYSHARHIKMRASSLEDLDDGEIEIGVTEVKSFVETDDGLERDYYELEPTKHKTSTTYKSQSIIDHIVSPNDEKGFKQEKTVEHKIITVGDTKITIDGENVIIETSKLLNIKTDMAKIETNNCEIKGNDVKVDGKTVTITGGTLKTKGASNTDLNGPFNAIKACPFSGAPHCGSSVSGT